jgi:hypothetical protein
MRLVHLFLGELLDAKEVPELGLDPRNPTHPLRRGILRVLRASLCLNFSFGGK